MTKRMNRRKVLETLGMVVGGTVITKAASAQSSTAGTTDIPVNIKFFSSLKEAKKSKETEPGQMIHTSGYFAPGDGGGATYLVTKSEKNIEANDGDIIKLHNDNLALLTGIDSVNYKTFGVIGDGKNDDGVQIKLAHDYANKNRLPVVNTSGEYWIKETKEIPIQTSVHWGVTTFHIDETYNSRQPVFAITGYSQPREIILDENGKKGLLEKLKPGVQLIPELKDFVNCLVVIRDRGDRIGNRAGYPGQSQTKSEFFYIEEHGKVVGDIAWSFNDFTQLTAFPAEESYLTVEGGTFYISGEGASREGRRRGYLRNGFSITRSRTIVRNQWVGLEKGKTDTAMNPRSGFYSLSTAYDVTLENIRLLPWEKDRPGNNRDVEAGTYGIGGNTVLKTTFRNITAEGSSIHWGVFGTNLNKDFRVENCRLNRIDVHFHCWNLTIKDSHIGNKGITVTGGGDLIIENTSVETTRFVNFRRDFGAKWDGDIYIKNCRLKPGSNSETAILFFMAADFDYGYPIGYAKSITIDTFKFDFRGSPDNQSNSWLIKTSPFSKTSEGKRLFFPEHMHFKDISCEGRKKGLKLMELPGPQGFFIPNKIELNHLLFEHNASIRFDNIQLEKTEDQDEKPYHFAFNSQSDDAYDEHSLYPAIQIKNCNALAVDAGNSTAQFLIENCEVNRFIASVEEPVPGEITFQNCRFIPQTMNGQDRPYQLSANHGTSFINCTVHLPRKEGKPFVEGLSQINFMDINRSVRYNHINTRLGRDILSHLKNQNITIDSHFLSKLIIHHEIEDNHE